MAQFVSDTRHLASHAVMMTTVVTVLIFVMITVIQMAVFDVCLRLYVNLQTCMYSELMLEEWYQCWDECIAEWSSCGKTLFVVTNTLFDYDVFKVAWIHAFCNPGFLCMCRYYQKD